MSAAKKALRAAREHLAAKNYKEAVAECKAALQQDPKCFEAYLYVGKATFLMGEYDQSDAAYQRALAVNDQVPQAWQGLAELHTEAGQWAKAADAYEALVNMVHRGDPALAGKLPALTRRLAEAHVACGQLEEAEAALTDLLRQHPSSAAALLAGAAPHGRGSAPATPTAGSAAVAAAALAAAAAAASPAAAAAAAAAGADAPPPLDPEERLSLLCLLADIQLKEDAAEMGARVSARIARRLEEEGGDASKVNEAYERAQALAEAADEALELECDHATGTLKEVVLTAPPTERYAPYYDAYLHRLRRAVQVAPPGSMARHQRRVAVLEMCRATMEGVSAADACAVGRGCAAPYAFETALRYLEIEEEVAGAPTAPPSRPMSRAASGMEIALPGVGSVPPSPRGLPGSRTPSAAGLPGLALFNQPPPPSLAPGSFVPPPLLGGGGSFFGSMTAQSSILAQLGPGDPYTPPSPARAVSRSGGSVSPDPRSRRGTADERYASAARLCELVSNPMAHCDEPPAHDLASCGSALAAGAASVGAAGPGPAALLSAGFLTPSGSGLLAPLPPLATRAPSAVATPRAGSAAGAAFSLPPPLLQGGMSRYGSLEIGINLLHQPGAAVAAQLFGGASGGATPLAGAAGGSSGCGGGGSVAPLLARDSEAIAQRLVHAFPWNKLGQAHLALALRRREAYLPSGAATLRLQCAWGGPHTTDWSCTEAELAARRSPARRKRRRTGLIAVLKRALAAGAPSTSAFIGLAELCLDAGDDAGALDASKRGIKFVFERSRAGHERARHAALMLNLLAAQARGSYRSMSRCGQLENASKVFSRLAARVSEGEVAFGSVGLPPLSIRHEAIRGLAAVALARGDRPAALQLYGELVSKALMGRGTAEHWAFGEYGWLLFESGQADAGRMQLETALDVLARAAPLAAEAAAAEYHFKLGRVYWALGGELRRDRDHAHAQFLEAAGEDDTPWQAPAFEWLGHWYRAVARDEQRARKCYSRALALDPSLAGAGDALVALLLGEPLPDGGAAGRPTSPGALDSMEVDGAQPPQEEQQAAQPAAPNPALARRVCEDALARAPRRAGWARAALARLQLAGRECGAAVASFQDAMRAEPADAALWEGLGAAYQALGRHSSALKSYERALELAPGRLYSLAQAGALLYMAGHYAESADRYRGALQLQPKFPAAQLGLAETLLASARLHARMGAAGAAAAELREAAAAASACARGGGGAHMVTAWKLLGDVLMQHSAVPPAAPPGGAGADAGGGAGADAGAAAAAADAAGAQRSLGTRLVAMRAARRAYLRAVHLEPSSGPLWGDLAGSCHQEAGLLRLQAAAPPAGGGGAAAAAARAAAGAAAARAERLARGGLRLAPADAWMWRQLGAVAGDPAVVEALQLDPKDAMSWVLLGRLYTRHDEAALAQRCYEQARSVEPTAVAVWEAMAATAAARRPAPGAARDAFDAAEHAVGLGGGPESWAAFAAGAALAGRAAEGGALAAAAKGAAAAPLLLAAHNSYGLAAEARGMHADAAAAFRRGLAVLELQPAAEGGDQIAGGADGGGAPYTLHLHGAGAGGGGGAAAAAPGALTAALHANLARALVRSGRHAEALEIYSDLAAAGALAGQPYAWICFAFAAAGAGGGGGGGGSAAAARGALEAALREAVDAEALFHAVLASLQFALSEGRLEDGFALLLQYAPELALALPGGTGPARVSRLWLSLLAAAARAPGAPGAAGAGEWATALRQWAAATEGADTAEIEAALLALAAAREAAAGRHAAALVTTASAVRAAPWLAPLRARLAGQALLAGAAYASAAARACPPAAAADAEAAARGSRGGGAAAAVGGAGAAGVPPELLVPAAAAARAEGLAGAAAAAVAREAGAEVPRLQALLHVAPGAAGLWALLASASLQRAAGTGQAWHYRHAAACAAAAAARLLALVSRESGAAARGGAGALQAVRSRLLAGEAEGHLHARRPGGLAAARAAADAALAAAAAAEADGAAAALPAAAAARRQAARVLWAEGRPGDAERAYARAADGGDACARLELAVLLARVGRGEEAAALLRGLREGGGGGGGCEGGRFETAGALEEAALLAGLADLQGARAAAAAALAAAEARGPGAPEARAAAHLVTADIALRQGRATLPDLAKNLLLEARFHAAAAARAAVCLPGDAGLSAAGVSAALLAAAEAARGRPDRAVEPLAAGISAFAARGAAPAGLWRVAGEALGDAAAWQRAVHADPTCRAAWEGLRSAAAAAGGGGGAAA
ncbi:MAG: hypothetical protein J3K34DRAFT_518511 [Monoraphidium minutum]|nr:MAG: hypothetical protein J3K34DRAFT_518511 [Monoraphidium minutum]